jgi:hypothetical protein
LFGLNFSTEENEQIEEVEPVENTEIKKSKKEVTLFADASNVDPTHKINYELEKKMQENVSPDEETIAIYKKTNDGTEEVCRDLATGTAHIGEVKIRQIYSLTKVFAGFLILIRSAKVFVM